MSVASSAVAHARAASREEDARTTAALGAAVKAAEVAEAAAEAAWNAEHGSAHSWSVPRAFACFTVSVALLVGLAHTVGRWRRQRHAYASVGTRQ